MHFLYHFRGLAAILAPGITVRYALDIIHDITDVEDIYIAPPEPDILTDEDSGDEDEGGTADNLSRRQLLADAEIRFSRELPQFEEIDFVKPGEPRNWVEGDFESFKKPFPLPDYSQFMEKSPVDLFELFFDKSVINLLLEESNRYAVFKNFPNADITESEIKCFIGILITSGYNENPTKRHYWDTKSDTRNDMIADSMRRNRFEMILRFLHCENNEKFNPNDKLWKIRPIIDLVKGNCIKYFIPEKELSYDESMVKYYGKHGCKQFIRGKPIRFGYKVWSLNTVQGYLVNFDIYQGKSPQEDHKICNAFGKAASPLVHMIEELSNNAKCLPLNFFFDNLFTSLNLLGYMRQKGYGATGTIRENRIPRNCPLPNKTTLKKKERGYFVSSICKEDGVLLAKWVDNSVVCVASNTFGINPLSNAKRYSQKEKKHITVSRPSLVTEYNKYMGGTDRMDQNVAQYRINIRNKKWYWPLVTWLIDISIHNAWIICRKTGKTISQLDFRREIAQFYLQRYKTPRKAPGPQSSISKVLHSDLRYDRYDHFIEKVPDGKRRRCAGNGCNSSGRTMCNKCNVGLCIDCFKSFHTK